MNKEIEEFTNSIALEIATMKFQIYSIYKSLTGDEKLNKVLKWEDECRKLAEQHLNNKYNKGKGKEEENE